MLLVDDLQWGDSASLELIVNLVRLAADAAIRKLVYLFAVLIVRDEVGSPERPELDLLKRETITTSLTLHGLTELEVSRLANAVGARDVPRAVISDVTRVTRGNPLFVVALVKQFAASDGGRRPDTVAAGRLPSELQGLIGARVSGLSSACQDMLTMAAVLGKGCSFAELETVTGIERGELGDLLDEAEDADVLVDSGDRYDFAHPLYERAVLARLSKRRRHEAHRRIADVLIQQGEDANASPMAIAQHLLDAGEFADPALVFEYCPNAGDSASAALAPGDAARYYEAALSAAERLRDAPREPLAHLALRAAVTRLQNGEPAAALHDADAAIANLGGDAPADALARAWSTRLRAELMARTPGHPADIGPLESLAPELETSAPRVAARVYGALANYYANAARDVDKARWACTRAIDLGNRHDEHSACADGWGQLAVTQWIHLELADAVESLRAESFHATRCADRSKLSHSMALLPLTLVWLGRFDEAETAIDQARRASREMSFFLREGFVALAEALLATARGMYIESDAAVEDAIEIGRLTGDQWPTSLIMPLLAWTRFLRGDDEGTEAVLEQWAPAGAPADRAMFAWLLHQHRAATAGRPPARLELEALWARLSSSPGFSADTAAVLVVELAAEVGASELAAQAGEFLADLANRGQVFTTTMGLFIPRAVGVAAAACGDNADARARLENGIELATTLRAHAELAASEYTLASVLVDDAEKTGALSLLESAHRTAGALGLLPLALRCEALAQRLDTSLVEPSQLHRPGRRTARGSEASAPTEMAVVMFTDIADSVALTEELGDWVFHDRARALQASLRRTIRTLAGRPVEGIKLGDGILAEFRSAEPAIRCAVTCSAVANDAGLPLHIGVHAGDVIRDQGDIFGGSVNTAARICSQAPAGHVFVSQTIRDLARTSSAFTFRPLGPHALKGIAEPVPLFSVEAAS
jgi:class 3 adenylate cyclase